MISSIRRTIAAALALACCLGAAIRPAQAASTAITYDTTTKLVVMPTAFWTSNVVAATGYTPTNSAGRLALILDANLLDLVDGSLTGSKVGAGISGDNITTGTVADARIAATLARLASPSFTGTPLVNSTNLMAAIDGKQGLLSNSAGLAGALSDETGTGVAVFSASPALTGTPTVNGTNFMALIGAGGGGGSGNASTNATQTWPSGYTQTFLGPVVFGGTTTISNAAFDSISAQSLTLSNALGQASGGTGGTNVATAQDALQITPGTYTQAYNASLAQIAGLSLQSGDLLYHDGSQLQRLAKATNNQVLTLISGLPTWRDAPGNTNSTTNATTLAQIADVSISTNALRRNDIIGWNGSNKWVRIPPPAAFSNSDRYEGWHVGCTTTSYQSPYASTLFNSGAGTANAGVIFGRSGYIRATTASSSAALYTGSSWMTGVTHLYGTNELFFHAEVRGAQTNGAAGRIGFFDSNSTNVFSNALGFTVTNNVWKFIAGLNGNFTLSGTSFVPDTNAWHQVEVYMTNAVAAVQVFTNGVLAFSDSISSTNVPVGATFGCGVNFFGNGASSTNGQDMVIINDVGHCYSKF